MRPEMNLGVEIEQLMETQLDPVAVHEAEWSRKNESFIRYDQAAMLRKPNKVHERIIIGPSNFGKSQIVDHISQTHMQDPDFSYTLQVVTSDADRQYLPLRVSFGDALDFVTKKYGKEKPQANEFDRKETSALMNKGILVIREAFENHPDFTVEIFAEVVGVTRSDLGTSVVKAGLQRPNTKIIVPKPNAQIENRGRELRNLSVDLQEGENLSEYARSRGVIFDNTQHTVREKIMTSSGLEEARIRQWLDIYDQIVDDQNIQLPSRDDFLSDENQDTRMRAYWNWISARYLPGLTHDMRKKDVKEKIITVENTFVNYIHYHIDKLVSVEQMPYSLLDSDKNTYEVDEILDGMPRLKERLQNREETIVDFTPSHSLFEDIPESTN